MSKCDLPDRAIVRSYLCDLISAKRTRTEVSDWATQWILGDYDHICVRDWPAWEMLFNLAGADLINFSSGFLHNQADFEDWLSRLDKQS